MNTAAPNAAYVHTHQSQNQPPRHDPYAADRISAQEAMKSMRISDSHQRDVSMKMSSASYTKRSKAESGVIQIDTAMPEKLEISTERVESIDSNNASRQQYQSYQQQLQQQQQHSYRQSQASYTSAHSQSDYSAAPQTASVAAPSTASVNTTHSQPAPTSGRQSRMSNANSSRESYRRKYGELPGYSYIGTIGQGNFGKVLLAENDTTGEQVAVKILEKAQFKSEQQRLHATREARLMATLRHPNIVDVKTVLEDDARILIVMENLTGGELFDYISNKGCLDEKEARRIFHQIVLAIHYCHENNVVHRDLKPENILLDSEKNVRVADFGFGNNWHKDRHLTTYCGSPFYAAPEMVSGTPYIGPETDVWSLGVILYVLVCGRLPFDASDLPQLFAQIKRGNYQKPREGSIDVCSLIHRMLTVDPKRRATLSGVLRSRWMRIDGVDSMSSVLPSLSTAPVPLRPVSVMASSSIHPPSHHCQPRPQQVAPSHQPQQQHPTGSSRSTALPTYHPNDDISTTMPVVNGQYRNEPQNRHSYHPPGAHELRQQHEYQFQQNQIQYQSQPQQVAQPAAPTLHCQQQQQQQAAVVAPTLTPITTTAIDPLSHDTHSSSSTTTSASSSPSTSDPHDQDDTMSDASPVNSPTDTMATISPSTPAPLMDHPHHHPYCDSTTASTTPPSSGGGKYTRSSSPVSSVTTAGGDDKHHPYKHHYHSNNSRNPDNVTINMLSPSSDHLSVEGIDSSLKKKRKALTKLRQFFRFENKV
ncbi:NUAK SNF1-like kinase 2 [Podila humilis]|nr:NUAK SNF1-like kinase 2 [Podila humilis]